MNFTTEDLRLIIQFLTALAAAYAAHQAKKAKTQSQSNGVKLVDIGGKVDGRLDTALTEINGLKDMVNALQGTDNRPNERRERPRR